MRGGRQPRREPSAPAPPLSLLGRRIGRSLRVLPRAEGHHPVRGGRVIAFLGGDGAGKSTCVGELSRWLGGQFDVMRAHLGRPPRSLTTLLVRALPKLRRLLVRGTQTTLFDMLRHVCTARDRYRLFTTVRSFADAGGVALCERYPVPPNRLLVGPELPRLLESRRTTPLARRPLRT